MDSSELLELVRETKKQLLHLQALGVEGVQLSTEAVPVFQPATTKVSQTEPVSLFGDLAPHGERLASSQETFEEIHNEIGDCTRCPLHRERTTVVHTEGNRKARLMF